MLIGILWPDHIQWQPPTDHTLYQTRPFTEFWVVSIEHLRRVWHADRGRLLLRTPGPVLLGLAYVLLVETNPFPSKLVVILPDYAPRIPLGTFSILHCTNFSTRWIRPWLLTNLGRPVGSHKIKLRILRDEGGLSVLKLYCRYLYTRPCMINHIWGLKQLWLQVNGHAWFHLQRLRWPVRNGEGAKNSKWKYMSPAGLEPTPRQSTTGKLQRLRPLGHEGLLVISG